MGATLVILFAVVEALLLTPMGRTSARHASSAAPPTRPRRSNVQRQALPLNQQVASLEAGDPTATVALRRGAACAPARRRRRLAHGEQLNTALPMSDASSPGSTRVHRRFRRRSACGLPAPVRPSRKVFSTQWIPASRGLRRPGACARRGDYTTRRNERSKEQLLIARVVAFAFLPALGTDPPVARRSRRFRAGLRHEDRSEQRFQGLVEQLPCDRLPARIARRRRPSDPALHQPAGPQDDRAGSVSGHPDATRLPRSSRPARAGPRDLQIAAGAGAGPVDFLSASKRGGGLCAHRWDSGGPEARADPGAAVRRIDAKRAQADAPSWSYSGGSARSSRQSASSPTASRMR